MIYRRVIDDDLGVGAGHARDIRDRDVQDAQIDHDVHGEFAGRRIQADDAALGNRVAVLVSRGSRYEARLLEGGLGLVSPTFRFRTGLSRGAARERRLWGVPLETEPIY